jgi:hypothetical protein
MTGKWNLRLFTAPSNGGVSVEAETIDLFNDKSPHQRLQLFGETEELFRVLIQLGAALGYTAGRLIHLGDITGNAFRLGSALRKVAVDLVQALGSLGDIVGDLRGG